MYKYYVHYKGGVNNLYVVCDEKGNSATSLKNHATAEKNLKQKLKQKRSNYD